MANRPLAELIVEQNRLAQAKAPYRPATVVRVLVAGRYNGPDLKSVRANAGDIIAVAGGRYADSLIADGYVEIPVEEAPAAGEPDYASLPISRQQKRRASKRRG